MYPTGFLGQFSTSRKIQFYCIFYLARFELLLYYFAKHNVPYSKLLSLGNHNMNRATLFHDVRALIKLPLQNWRFGKVPENLPLYEQKRHPRSETNHRASSQIATNISAKEQRMEHNKSTKKHLQITLNPGETVVVVNMDVTPSRHSKKLNHSTEPPLYAKKTKVCLFGFTNHLGWCKLKHVLVFSEKQAHSSVAVIMLFYKRTKRCFFLLGIISVYYRCVNVHGVIYVECFSEKIRN